MVNCCKTKSFLKEASMHFCVVWCSSFIFMLLILFCNTTELLVVSSTSLVKQIDDNFIINAVAS